MKSTFTFLLLVLISFLGFSQTWVRQNPYAELSQMHSIDFEGKYGIAVGADAKIFTTINSGAAWVQRTPTTTARVLEAAMVVPGTMGQMMLAGGDSILILTRDGGETWSTVYVEIPNIYKIQMLPNNNIMALGKDFGVYSIDNGYTWQPFNMPGFGVTAGHFVSIAEGWVGYGSFDNAQVWYTKNGGFDWEILDPFKHPVISSIEMLNDMVGFMAARDFVYKTIDGGLTWNPLNDISAHHIHDMFVVDEDKLWAAQDNGSIYFSTDGGSEWEERNPNIINGNRTLGIWADAVGKVWAVGKYQTILYSPNFGQDWTDQLPAAKQTLFAPDFNNAFTGMVGGSDGAILKTENSGATWELIQLARGEHFIGLSMINDSVAVAASTSGNIMRTTDFGITWNIIGELPGEPTDLVVLNDQIMIVPNELGDIYKTDNGGANWRLVYDGSQRLESVHFFNMEFGWAAGALGRVLISKDSGESWTIEHSEFDVELSDIHFPTNLEGWAVASSFSDSIWHSVDGGVTWEKIGLPLKTFWRGVSFMDRDTGWIVGGSVDNGVIYRTNTRGQSWFLDHTSPDPFMGIYSIPDSETAWAVGFGGNIMKFSSCASPPRLLDVRGNLEPCAGDTINYVVEFDDVDVFTWSFPSDWFVLGNTNTASIHFIAGSSPGQVTIQGSDACGDTTDLLSVDVAPVTPPDVHITEDNGSLVANVSGGIFQWLLNGEVIPGATHETYHPVVNGTYQLHFTTFTSGCETYSNVFKFGLIPTVFIDDAQIIAFPNPANDRVVITLKDGDPLPEGAEIIITNMDGKIMQVGSSGRNQLDVSQIPPGIYSLHVRTGKEILLKKIIVD